MDRYRSTRMQIPFGHPHPHLHQPRVTQPIPTFMKTQSISQQRQHQQSQQQQETLLCNLKAWIMSFKKSHGGQVPQYLQLRSGSGSASAGVMNMVHQVVQIQMQMQGKGESEAGNDKNNVNINEKEMENMWDAIVDWCENGSGGIALLIGDMESKALEERLRRHQPVIRKRKARDDDGDDDQDDGCLHTDAVDIQRAEEENKQRDSPAAIPVVTPKHPVMTPTPPQEQDAIYWSLEDQPRKVVRCKSTRGVAYYYDNSEDEEQQVPTSAFEIWKDLLVCDDQANEDLENITLEKDQDKSETREQKEEREAEKPSRWSTKKLSKKKASRIARPKEAMPGYRRASNRVPSRQNKFMQNRRPRM